MELGCRHTKEKPRKTSLPFVKQEKLWAETGKSRDLGWKKSPLEKKGKTTGGSK